jgi:hypothetical protein
LVRQGAVQREQAWARFWGFRGGALDEVRRQDAPAQTQEQQGRAMWQKLDSRISSFPPDAQWEIQPLMVLLSLNRGIDKNTQ